MSTNLNFFKKLSLLSFTLSLVFLFSAKAQSPHNSLSTGHLLDAADEYWPAITVDTTKQNFFQHLKHMPVNEANGFVSIGGSLREGYEIFDNYLWGVDKRDTDGYLLHRLLLHTDFRWNSSLRIFNEIENSLVIGRNGGPRPVQDENKLAINQIFAEYSAKPSKNTGIKIRLGKQALSYGIGTLLDVRDANVRLSFAGGKLIINHNKTRVDAFLMKAIKNNQGILDDEVNHSQKIAGVWMTRPISKGFLNKIDAYYIHISRKDSYYEQTKGDESRSTLGASIWSSFENVSGYTEADFQWGYFNNKNIMAWKVVQAVFYKAESIKFKPIISVHFAVSSGDQNREDGKVQTFNPLYPKAIFYGYIDNVGSSNIMVIHEKLETTLSPKLKLTLGYYNYWRESSNDGVYFANGSLLFSTSNKEKKLAEMYDLNLSFAANDKISVQLISSYAKRAGFLKLHPLSTGNIFCIGIKTNIFF